jgi:hypothetical protein
MGDYLEDLKDYSAAQISGACAEYRRQADARFYPTSGQLLAILRKNDPSPSHCRLPTYHAPRQLEAPRAVKSVAEVLAAHGFEKAAEDWKGLT